MESAARAALSRALDRGPGLQRRLVDAKRWSGMANDHAVAVATRRIADPSRHQHADLFARIAGRSTCRRYRPPAAAAFLAGLDAARRGRLSDFLRSRAWRRRWPYSR